MDPVCNDNLLMSFTFEPEALNFSLDDVVEVLGGDLDYQLANAETNSTQESDIGHLLNELTELSSVDYDVQQSRTVQENNSDSSLTNNETNVELEKQSSSALSAINKSKESDKVLFTDLDHMLVNEGIDLSSQDTRSNGLDYALTGSRQHSSKSNEVQQRKEALKIDLNYLAFNAGIGLPREKPSYDAEQVLTELSQHSEESNEMSQAKKALASSFDCALATGTDSFTLATNNQTNYALAEVKQQNDNGKVLSDDLDYALRAAEAKLAFDIQPKQEFAQKVQTFNMDTKDFQYPKVQSDGVKFHCKICGSAANGHSYYGAQTCGSCRAFFKRAALAKEALVCVTGDGDCIKGCRRCRFDKCVAAGMDPALVIKRISKKTVRGPSKMLDNYFTVDDEIHIKGIYSMTVAWEGEFIVNNLLSKTSYENLEKYLSEKSTFPAFCSQDLALEYQYYDYVLPKYLQLPFFQSMNMEKARKSLHEWYPATTELCLTFCANNSAMNLIMSYFYNEFRSWLKKDEQISSVSVPLSIKRAMLERGPKPMGFEEAYGKVPPELAKRHAELVQDVIRTMGELDCVAFMLVDMSVMMTSDILTRNHYLKLFYAYLKQHPHKLSFNREEMINMAMALPEKLNEMRKLRTAAYTKLDYFYEEN